MRRGPMLPLSLFYVLAGCGGPPPAPVDPSSVEVVGDELAARVTTGGLELVNSGTAPVYYRARDPETLALSAPVPCLEPTDCPSVPAGASVTVPFEEAIVGYRPDTEHALVYWWHFVQQPDGSAAADEVRTLEVSF
jgi:hypothetical protein